MATKLDSLDYKILKMNTASIKIGNRICQPGDVFSDKSIIYWKGDNYDRNSGSNHMMSFN